VPPNNFTGYGYEATPVYLDVEETLLVIATFRLSSFKVVQSTASNGTTLQRFGYVLYLRHPFIFPEFSLYRE
jgi:hypothetical protein